MKSSLMLTHISGHEKTKNIRTILKISSKTNYKLHTLVNAQPFSVYCWQNWNVVGNENLSGKETSVPIHSDAWNTPSLFFTVIV